MQLHEIVKAIADLHTMWDRARSTTAMSWVCGALAVTRDPYFLRRALASEKLESPARKILKRLVDLGNQLDLDDLCPLIDLLNRDKPDPDRIAGLVAIASGLADLLRAAEHFKETDAVMNLWLLDLHNLLEDFDLPF